MMVSPFQYETLARPWLTYTLCTTCVWASYPQCFDHQNLRPTEASHVRRNETKLEVKSVYNLLFTSINICGQFHFVGCHSS